MNASNHHHFINKGPLKNPITWQIGLGISHFRKSLGILPCGIGPAKLSHPLCYRRGLNHYARFSKVCRCQMTVQPPMHWEHHPHNPFNWPRWKKWMSMLTSCWVTFIVGLNATSITTAADAISSEFHLANGIFEYNFFAVTAWNAAAAFVPLATLPLMETYGMRFGFLVSSLCSCDSALVTDSIVGGIWSLYDLSDPTGLGPKFRYACHLPGHCWGFRRNFAKLRRWNSVEPVLASPRASLPSNLVYIHLVVWGDNGPCSGCYCGAIGVAMVSNIPCLMGNYS